MAVLHELPDLDWMSESACRGALDLFFPDPDLAKDEWWAATEVALNICESCSVIAECRAWAINIHESLEQCVVAGMRQEQYLAARREAVEHRRQNRRPKCGSEAAYSRHLTFGEDCAQCKSAHAGRKTYAA